MSNKQQQNNHVRAEAHLAAQADLAENGGTIIVTALFNLDGTIASTHHGYGQWGAYWVLNDAAAALYGLNKAIDEYANRQATNTKLDQQLANAGRLTDDYRAKLHGLAEELSAASAIDAGQWLAALGKIQGKDTAENLDKNATALKNLAAATGDVEIGRAHV